jgi:hypothetical protein
MVAAMPRELLTRSLAVKGVDQAYAVIRSAGVSFTLQRWRRYAGDLVRRGPAGCGILTVENRHGTIQGLCSYRMAGAPGGGTHCAVELIVALDLIDEGAVAAALLQATEALARRNGARALSVNLSCASPMRPALLARLGNNGLRIDQIRLLKPLSPVTGN